jgi:hypothetical protein
MENGVSRETKLTIFQAKMKEKNVCTEEGEVQAPYTSYFSLSLMLCAENSKFSIYYSLQRRRRKGKFNSV